MPSHGEGTWLIYALGGGLGHVTRALALARPAVAIGLHVHILTNSPFAARLPHTPDGISFAQIDPDHDVKRVGLILNERVERGGFDVFIVDTFPRGLGGELSPLLDRLTVPKIWIHRDLNPSYVRWANLRQVARAYDRVILPGEDAPLDDLPHGVRTAPWLLRDRDELLDRQSSRRILGFPDDERPGIVVMGTGRGGEIEENRRLALKLNECFGPEAAVRFVSLDDAIWPLLEVMAGIDLLVGSGGYNTVHEARATATPLLALARPVNTIGKRTV